MTKHFLDGYGLLIGINDNQVRYLALPDVIKDIAAVEAVLTSRSHCAYQPENVKSLVGACATRDGIFQGFEWLEKKMKGSPTPNATVVIYISGHGFQDLATSPPSYYLVPYDMKPGRYRERGIRAQDLAEAVSKVQPQRILVILDTCHSGGMGIKTIPNVISSAIPSALLTDEGEVFTPEKAKHLSSLSIGSGRAVLSSSQGEQRSYMRSDGKMSVFTYHLIEALLGHAQPQDGATNVLVSDIMSYVYRHVPQTVASEQGESQVPEFHVTGNFPIALLLGGNGLKQGDIPPNPFHELRNLQTMMSQQVLAEFTRNLQRMPGIVYGDHVVGDKVGGDKVAGDKITIGNVGSDNTMAIGRYSRATTRWKRSPEEVSSLFVPLLEVVNETSTKHRKKAIELVVSLMNESAKGDNADDNRLAQLIDGLTELVPGTATEVRDIFTSSHLSETGGEVTRYVLDKLQKR